MRRHKYYSYSSFNAKPRFRLRNSLILLVVAIPLLLVIAEFIAWGTFQVVGNESQSNISQDAALVQAYRLQLQDANGKPIGSGFAGALKVKRNAFVEYELIPRQSSKFWQINEQGFRDDRPVSLEKSSDEIRIFLLGGSTAFSQLAPSNQATLASKLEASLNERLRLQKAQPGKFKPLTLPLYADQIEVISALPPRIREGKYRVIAAAVPGYTSSNELAMLAHRVMAFNPDCIVALDGYEDMRSRSVSAGSSPAASSIEATEFTDPKKLSPSSAENYFNPVSIGFQDWLNSLYLTKAAYRWLIPVRETSYQAFNANQLPANAVDLDARGHRYRYNLRQMARLAGNVPVAIAIQPEITGKEPQSMTAEETSILTNLGNEYGDRAKAAYAEITKKVAGRELTGVQGLRVLNLYRLFTGFKQRAFLDPIHLTDAGNDLLAKRLSETLVEIFASTPATANEL